jgi:dihydroorotate dehydrogenase (NAD+) catalytic subunit
MSATTTPRYNRHKTYQWNYDHAPDPVEGNTADVPGDWRFCGQRVASPLGVPAGPLLNGRWLLYYASLGFDLLTYKTVRSGPRPCYDPPNLQPVDCGSLYGGEVDLVAVDKDTASWAVAFGMPSQSPDVWRADIERTRRALAGEKVLSVSVVGTIQQGWTIDQLADDYARCARWAAESGADCIETNFSCPNVATCDGQLYQEIASAALVAERVRAAIDETPLIIKVGHMPDQSAADALISAVSPYADALAMTNSVATTVVDASGRRLFDGQKRGICGGAIREASVQQTELFARRITQLGASLEVIGVGGISSSEHVREYLRAGASSVQLATAAMLDPEVGLKIRREWSNAIY